MQTVGRRRCAHEGLFAEVLLDLQAKTCHRCASAKGGNVDPTLAKFKCLCELHITDHTERDGATARVCRVITACSGRPSDNGKVRGHAAKKAATFSPLSFFTVPWARDGIPIPVPSQSQQHTALSTQAAAHALDALASEQAAAAAEAELGAHHRNVEELLQRLRQANADSVEAGLGRSMLVPIAYVPPDIAALVQEEVRQAGRSTSDSSASTTRVPFQLSGDVTAYGTGHEVILQGFNWDSHRNNWYSKLRAEAHWYSELGFTLVWMPPPTASVSPEGYMPNDYYDLNSKYGSADDLKSTIAVLHEHGLKAIGDVVLNHRCALHQDSSGVWNVFGGKLDWDARAIVGDDLHFKGKGNKSTGDNFHAAPNVDHTQDFVRDGISEWLQWLRLEIGFDGWRLDFAKGFGGQFVKEYCERTAPHFVVGEYWDSLDYKHGVPDYCQDAHRQRIVDWINAAGGRATAFDVTLKGIMHEVFARGEYWRLSDAKGQPPGVLGWWPSRAATFLENHDTGSTQGHWRFPDHALQEGYAYILTHPGTPTVFYDHIHDSRGVAQALKVLIQLRKQQKIHCKSTVSIMHCTAGAYVAKIDERTVVAIGHDMSVVQLSNEWREAGAGKHWCVWTLS